MSSGRWFPGRRRILARTMGLSWLLVALTAGVFVAVTVPFQRKALTDGLDMAAGAVASSIDQVTARAIVAEDYSAVVEHCTRVVQERPDILYVVVTRKDGFSLVHTGGGWRQEDLGGLWRPTGESAASGRIIGSQLVPERSFHFSRPFSYSGIPWGWIHIGVSLERYNRELRQVYSRAASMGMGALALGLAASLLFARRITAPISHLDAVTQRLAAGDLSARARVASGDELESLARSFNRMAESLGNYQHSLESSLRQKELLLREIHHRVKNNLQVLSSLLRLQSRQLANEDDRQLFESSQNRIRSIALLHEQLYRSEDMARVDLPGYVRELAAHLQRTFAGDQPRIEVLTEVEPIRLGIDSAIPCGLIVSELVTNAFKHAFPEGRCGEIRVSARALGPDEYELTVADNGTGMPADPVVREGGRSLGMRLVSILAEEQLHGRVEVVRGQGTAFRIGFRDIKYEKRT